MRQESAEVIALNALGWLAEHDLLDAFQSSTGADPAQIRSAAGEPEFLGAVLDFIMMSDDWVTGFCEAQRLPFDALQQARAALPGGDLPHWT